MCNASREEVIELADTPREEVIIAANRYVEGGRQPGELTRLAELIANAPTEETLQEYLRLAGGKPPPRKT